LKWSTDTDKLPPMKNLQIAQAWMVWTTLEGNRAGRVAPRTDLSGFPADVLAVAKQHFRIFAQTGSHSAIAMWAEEPDQFGHAPVVLLGHEGALHVLADNVLRTLALIAAGGDDFEAAVNGYTAAEKPNAPLAAWLQANYDVRPPAGHIPDLVASAGGRHGIDRLEARVAAVLSGSSEAWCRDYVDMYNRSRL
jgi:hypothetical protein